MVGGGGSGMGELHALTWSELFEAGLGASWFSSFLTGVEMMFLSALRDLLLGLPIVKERLSIAVSQ